MADELPPTTSLDDDWCSIAEAARRVGVTETAIRNRIKRRTLETRPLGNFGRQVRVPKIAATRSETVGETVPLTVLTDALVAELRDRLAELQGRLTVVDGERIELRRELDQERAAAAQERQKMLAGMVEAGQRLDTLQAEKNADREKYDRELEELRLELQNALERQKHSWWYRMFRAA